MLEFKEHVTFWVWTLYLFRVSLLASTNTLHYQDTGWRLKLISYLVKQSSPTIALHDRNARNTNKPYYFFIMYNVSTKFDVDMLHAIKSVLADIWSVSPSSEQSCSDNTLVPEVFSRTFGAPDREKTSGTRVLWQRINTRNVSNTLFMAFSISTSPSCWYIVQHVLPPRCCRPKLVLIGTSIPLHSFISFLFVSIIQIYLVSGHYLVFRSSLTSLYIAV